MEQFKQVHVRKILALLLALLAAIEGFLALMGWLLNLPLLASFGSGLIPMAPDTALLFILLGSVLALFIGYPENRLVNKISLVSGLVGVVASLILLILSSIGIYLPFEYLGRQDTGIINATTLGHLSTVSTFLFFISSLVLLFLVKNESRLTHWFNLAQVLAVLLILFSYIFALAYLAGLPLLYGGKTIPPSLPTSLAFLALGVALFLTAQSRASLTRKTNVIPFAGLVFQLFLTFIIIAISIITVGYVYFQNFEKQFRLNAEGQLSAIAALKVNGLEDWRNERLADGSILSDNIAFATMVQNYFTNPGDEHMQEEIQTWLEKYQLYYQYDRIRLMDLQGNTVLSVPDGLPPISPVVIQEFPDVLLSRQVTMVDFYRDDQDQKVFLTLLAPIFDPTIYNQIIGFVSLRIDPAFYLYPYINEWPIPSTTAETLLVRQQGTNIVFLNALRFDPQAALTLMFPLADTTLPAVKAVLGQTGVVQGSDYRGESVLADIRPVAASPWFLVTKVDISEVYAPLNLHLWQTILFFGLLVVASGAGMIVIWRQQRVRFYRTRAEVASELRESELRYRRLFEASRDGVLILDGETGAVTDVNPIIVDLLNISKAEILGKKLWELGFFKDIATSNAIFLELQEKDYVRYDDLPFESPDGRVIHVELVCNRFAVDENRIIQCNVRDISERWQAENILKVRLRLVEYADSHPESVLLQKALDEVCLLTGSPIGFYHFVEPDQKTISLQAWSTRTLQEYCNAEGQGLHYSLDQAGVWADVIPLRKAVIHNDYGSLPSRKGLPSGHAALIRELVVPILRDGLIVAILGVGNKLKDYEEDEIKTIAFFADVTWELVRRKRTEQKVAEYTENLEKLVKERTKSLEDAQEKIVRQERLATLGQVAGSIGHELRNPLGVISNAVYFLKMAQPEASERVKEYLDIIEKETRTSDKFITDLLDFTRMKSLDRQPAFVSDLVHKSLERNPVPQSVELEVNLGSDLPQVFVDPQHFLQVLGNITVNACQAMDSQTSKEDHVPLKLTVSACLQGDMIRLDVQDTGEGISPENMNKLFEPLFTTKVKGIGLGLAVSRKLVEANGGRIEVHSDHGQGTTFSIFLQVYQPKSLVPSP